MVQEGKKPQLLTYLDADAILSVHLNRDKGKQGQLRDWYIASIAKSAEINHIS